VNPPMPGAPLPGRWPTRRELSDWWALRPWRCRARLVAFCRCPSYVHAEGCEHELLPGYETVIGLCAICDGTHVWSTVGI
jgi:hypothetical protein